MRRIAVLAAVSLQFACLCGCNMIRATSDLDLNAAWSGYERLTVESHNGSVRISPGQGADVSITGKKYVSGHTMSEATANLERIEVRVGPDASSPHTLRIEVVYPEELNGKSPGAELRIVVPAAALADATTSNGSIELIGMKGPSRLKSSNGSLTIRDAQGAIRGETSNAAIRAEKIAGDAELVTSNGSISATEVGGACTARTSNGRIDIRAARGAVEARSSNGSIEIEAQPPTNSPVVAETSNSSIKLRLPRGLAGVLDLSTSNGRLDADLKGMAFTVDVLEKNQIRGAINGGGPGHIRAHTSNGSIRLEWQ